MEQLTDLKLPSDGKEEVAMNDDMREDLAAGDGAASVDVSESNDIEGAHTPEDMAVEDEQPEEDKIDDPMLQTEDPEKGRAFHKKVRKRLVCGSPIRIRE